MKSLSLLLFFVLCTAVALAEQDIRSRMKEVLSFRSLLPHQEASRSRGVCQGREENKDIDPCEGCKINTKWQNEQVVIVGTSNLDFVQIHQNWRFLLNHTLSIQRTALAFVTQEFADYYNDIAQDSGCKPIEVSKPFLEITEATQGLYDYPAGCTLYTCADDSPCDVTIEYQSELCGEDDPDMECSFPELAPFPQGTPTDFSNKCKILDLDITSDDEFYTFQMA